MDAALSIGDAQPISPRNRAPAIALNHKRAALFTSSFPLASIHKYSSYLDNLSIFGIPLLPIFFTNPSRIESRILSWIARDAYFRASKMCIGIFLTSRRKSLFPEINRSEIRFCTNAYDSRERWSPSRRRGGEAKITSRCGSINDDFQSLLNARHPALTPELSRRHSLATLPSRFSDSARGEGDRDADHASIERNEASFIRDRRIRNRNDARARNCRCC